MIVKHFSDIEFGQFEIYDVDYVFVDDTSFTVFLNGTAVEREIEGELHICSAFGRHIHKVVLKEGKKK